MASRADVAYSCHGVGDVGRVHRPRGAVRLHALGVGIHLAGADGGRRPNDLRAGRQVRRMGHPARVHQLHEDLSALGVDRVGDSLPSAHLGFIEEARDARVAEAVGRRRGALGDDQAGRRALAVVLGHQGVGRVGIDGAAARHRRHDGAVGELNRGRHERFEEHGSSLFDSRHLRKVAGRWRRHAALDLLRQFIGQHLVQA